MMEAAFAELEPLVRTKRACTLTGRSRATHYRHRNPQPRRAPEPRPSPPNALTAEERQAVLDALHAPAHADLPPAQVWARLLDDGVYLASISTMYRLLRSCGESRDRRRTRVHPARSKPELVAKKPNDVWSWDITKLQGPERGVFFQLYALIDIYSRYVPGWVVAEGESGELAEQLIADAVARNGTAPGALHADRGGAMTSKPVAQLLVDLGVDRSHSRPRVSNDNPFSESQFKTLKYFPTFPDRFGSIADARAFCALFFDYYNHEHRHRSLGLHTPASVHFGTAHEVRAQRAAVLDEAYAANPLRFTRRPQPPRLPEAAWINQPTPQALIQSS